MKNISINKTLFILIFLNLLFFYLGRMGVGNDIWNFLTGLGKFGDFHPDIIFDMIKTHPRANDSGQFPAFDIIYVRIFNSNKTFPKTLLSS
jgi:hypothetical protein